MKDHHILPFLWMRGEAPEILRREIEKIYEAGIRAVCLEARPHPDYAGEGWWQDVDIVAEEAKKREMQIWILDDAHFPTGMANNGLQKHPEKSRKYLFTQFVDVTGPIPAAQVDVELLMTKQVTWMDIGKPASTPLRDETRLLSVTASKIYNGDVVEGCPIDLTEQVEDGYLTTDIPEGTWRINVNFSTTLIGPKLDYINYVDEASVQVLIEEVYEKHYERYKEFFGNTIAGFFSDEPGFYNTDTYDENNFVGLHMPLPWGEEVEQYATAKYGTSIYRDIPFLFAKEKTEKQRTLRAVYMDVISELYSKNFSSQLGNWCRNHGVQYIGHVVEDNCGHMRLGAGCGHYFRAMAGQDMAGIDNIGYQIMPGNDVANRHTGFQDLNPEFYHYQLGKLGASSAAIDPAKKGRLMCENFGAYGWRLGVRDMKWLVDYLIGQGVNYFVPHAFSMAEYPDADCPPHFYAGGMNPQFPYFCELMKYTDRLCRLFSDGKNVPQAAVLYEAESDWVGNTMRGSAIGKELITHQIDFQFVPSDVFANEEYYGCRVENGKLVINERSMNVLIIPECDYLPAEAAAYIAGHPELFVIYLNKYPAGITGNTQNEEELLAKATENKVCTALNQLSETLISKNIRDEVYLEEGNSNLQLYHYNKDGREIYHLMNVSLSESIEATLHVPENLYGRYDAMTDCTEELSAENNLIHIVLPPYGSEVIVTNPTDAVAQKEDSCLYQTILFNTFNLELLEIGNPAAEKIENFSLRPVSSFKRDFSGIMNYSTKIEIKEKAKKAVFTAEHVFECMTITVNGTKFPAVIAPPYRVDVSSALVQGTNEIMVSVASTALRNANTKPGIFGRERTIIEPAGMFGKAELELFK